MVLTCPILPPSLVHGIVNLKERAIVRKGHWYNQKLPNFDTFRTPKSLKMSTVKGKFVFMN